MKEIKRNFNLITIGTMLIDIVIIILGFFLVANPAVGTNSALILIGIILVVSGLYSIVKYMLNNRVIFKFELIYGILSLITGFLAIYKPFSIINIVTVLIGCWLLLSSIFKFFIAVELKKVKIESYTFDMAISGITAFLGLFLIINPFGSYIYVTTYIAILMIMYAGIDFVEQLTIRKRASKILKFLGK